MEEVYDTFAENDEIRSEFRGLKSPLLCIQLEMRKSKIIATSKLERKCSSPLYQPESDFNQLLFPSCPDQSD